MFTGYLALRDRCDQCGLDYAKADSGDGPAVFVIFIVGFIAVALAFILRFSFYAPIWLSFGLSAFVACALTIALLRPLKGVMIALQFQHKAEEGRLND